MPAQNSLRDSAQGRRAASLTPSPNRRHRPRKLHPMAKQKEKGLFKRGDIWQLSTDPLTGRQITTKCHDLEAAIAFRDERERLANAPPESPAQCAELGEWLAKYFAVRQNGRSEATIRYIESKLGQIRRLLGDGRRLQTIGPGLFDWYVAQRRAERGKNQAGQEQRVSDATINRELRELVGLLRLAKRAGCYEGDLQALMPTDLDPRYEPGERALTEDEIVPFLEALPTATWRAYAAICIGLGCRQSEACRLRPEDVEIRTAMKDGEEVEDILVWIDGRKTVGSNRVIPVLSSFVPLLKLAMPELPIGPLSNFDRTFKIACKKAGIAPCSSNDLRRTNATLAGSRGLPDALIARLLGHETASMSRRVYNRAQAIQLKPLAEKILSQAEPIKLPSKLRPISVKAPGRTREPRELQ